VEAAHAFGRFGGRPPVGSGPYIGTSAQAADGSGMVIRRVWERPSNTGGKPSPDGRYLTFNDWDAGNLAIRDLDTGETRLLTNNKGPWPNNLAYPEFSIWSPDGTQVAYSWWSQEEIEEIRLIGLDGSEPRVIYSNPEIYAIVADWFPEGKTILAVFQYKDKTWQIARVSVADGTARVLRKFDWYQHYPQTASLSPDAEYIAYDFPAAENSPQRDIYALAADGSRENPLVAHPANDRLLGWAPDGTILFRSDRTGEDDLWIVQVKDGKPAEEPKLLKRGIGPISPIGFTTGGSFFYERSTGTQDVYVAEVDLATGNLLSPPARPTELNLGSTTYPDWSPNGEYLAYLVRRMGDNQIRIRSLTTGQERELEPSFRRGGTPHWSPDGRSLLVRGEKEGGTRGCYLLDVQSGRSTTILESDRENHVASVVWSRDGKAIFYNAWDLTSWERHGRIVKREFGTGRETVLHSMPYSHNPVHMAVSPDGRQLAFTHTFAKIDDEYQPASVMLIPTTGGEPREAVRLDLDMRIVPDSIAWTRDGRYILFGQSGRGIDGAEIWRVSPEGGQPEKLLGLDLKVGGGFRFHPDGRRIAFVAGQGGSEIWVMENFLPELKAGQ
jgi:Tol biopolymer transport system component